MKFYDKVSISVNSWKWGDGLVSARREKYVPYGGPSGWDGGKWGSVIMHWSKDKNTLLEFVYKKKFKAAPGENWMTADKYWKDSEDVVISVPLGTIIRHKETQQVLFQFLEDGQTYVIAKWWKWGAWNIHFKNSVRQFPNFALLGEPGQKKEIELELQLLWDVALVWTPSVWKSTIINSISAAKAKVADYPFTTLIPNLWMVHHWDTDFCVIDVPWLIEGASQGRGIWNEFLRHILKSKILAFVLDLSRYEASIWECFLLINELKEYITNRFVWSVEFWKKIESVSFDIVSKKNEILFDVYGKIDKKKVLILRKQCMIVFNKFDTIDDEELLQEYKDIFHAQWLEYFDKKFISEKLILPLCSFTRYGTEEFLDTITGLLKLDNAKIMMDIQAVDQDHYDIEDIQDISDEEIPSLIEHWYLQERDAKFIKVWKVQEEEFCRLVFMLPWWNDEAEYWFWEVIGKSWITNIFTQAGIQKWDVLKVISRYEWTADKYVMRD